MPQKSNFGSPPAKPGVYLGEINSDSVTHVCKGRVLFFAWQTLCLALPHSGRGDF